jgi:SAM-dependent methyltransferase
MDKIGIELGRVGCPICGIADEPSFVCSKDGFEISKCRNCGVGRTVAPKFDPQEFYTADYFNGGVECGYRDYEGSQSTLRREFAGQLDFLRSYLPQGGRLLEIGCAYGFFLQQAKPFFDVYGLEVSEVAVDCCRRNDLPNVRQGVVTEDALADFGSFDAIVLLDVIEHIDDVAEAMRILVGHLKPGACCLSRPEIGIRFQRGSRGNVGVY